MVSPIPGGNGGSPVQLIDRLAYRIIGALHALLGVSYTENAEHYVYQLTFNLADAAAIGTIASGAIRISQEAAFVCTAIQCGCRVDDTGNHVGLASTAGAAEAGAIADAPYTIALLDGGTDRQLQNQEVDAALVYSAYGAMGQGKLGRPKLFRPNSNVQVNVTTLKAAAGTTGFDIRVALIGYKIYKAGADDVTIRVR